VLLGFGTWVGCGAEAPASRKPEISQVMVPVDRADDSSDPDETRFHCDEPAAGERIRVEFQVQSASPDGSSLVETRAVYLVEPRPGADHRLAGAEVVLESLSTEGHDQPDQAQSAWTIALEAGWIELRRPFEIARHESTWCFSSDCEDTSRHAVAKAIGDTAELVLLPELAEQLGQSRDANALTLPDVVVERMGLGETESEPLSPTARRRGRQFPALFVVERGDLVAPDTDSTSTPSLSAELLVSQSCRLRALKVELASNRPPAPGTTATHRFSWRFDPAP
jgi:hypothetical protein